LILRESGMPEQNMWETFFTTTDIFKIFRIDKTSQPIVDVGCGYGTFTIPLAKIVKQNIYAIDIDDKLLKIIESQQLSNIQTIKYDVFENKIILPEKVGSILLFNMLHCENPKQVIENILPNLSHEGVFYVIHWRSDISTPRGPSMDIRPRPDYIINLFKTIEFEKINYFNNISQYHFGLTFQRR
jgi:SAM-dependent methyltransferase